MSGAEEKTVVCLYVKQLELLAQLFAKHLQLIAQLLDLLLKALLELPEANLRLHASTHIRQHAHIDELELRCCREGTLSSAVEAATSGMESVRV
jgi:hypothetical protein